MSLQDLLAAERALGRLTEALSRDDAHGLWQADALRREALASSELDGQKVDWEDLAVAQIDPALLGHELRSSVEAPLRLIAAAHAMERGLGCTQKLHPPQSQIGPTGSEVIAEELSYRGATSAPAPQDTEVLSVLAAARKAAADIDAFMGGATDEEVMEMPPLPSPPPPVLPPLSTEWLAAAWRLYSPDHPPLPLPEVLTDIVESGLTQPGLAGLSVTIRNLEQHGPFPCPLEPDYGRAAFDPDLRRKLALAHAEHQQTDRKFSFIRLLSPWLMQRACNLPFKGPWLSPALLQAGGGRIARIGREDDWTSWIYQVMASGFDAERHRLARLATLVHSWLTKFSSGKRRWVSSRNTFALLIAHPATTTRWLERERRISRRAAQMLVNELQDAGIVRHVHHAKGREWYVADEVRSRY